MATMNISLPDPMREWVKTQIDSGQYANSSDYVRDLIRRDQRRAAKQRTLQEAITKGLASGAPQTFDPEAFKQQMMEHLPNGDL